VLKIKRILYSIIAAIFSFIFIGCTATHDDPEYLYKQNPKLDMFVYEGIAYVNASNLEWVAELELTPLSLLGLIEETRVSNDFQSFSATKLEVGIEVYLSNERDDIFLVNIGGGFIPYIAWIEG
jgi:hypothetical protein